MAKKAKLTAQSDETLSYGHDLADVKAFWRLLQSYRENTSIIIEVRDTGLRDALERAQVRLIQYRMKHLMLQMSSYDGESTP